MIFFDNRFIYESSLNCFGQKEWVIMNKISILFLGMFVMLLSMVPFTMGAYTSASSMVHVTLMSQTPDPVEPGEIVTVKFKVENNGTETNRDAIVTLLPQYPFSLYGDVAEKNIGKLRAGSRGSNAIIVEYKLKVDQEATESETELELKVQLGDAAISYMDNQFKVDIQTQDAVLDISSITFEPEQIRPGEVTEVTFVIKNLADSTLKNIKFKMNLNSSTIPFAPYKSSSEKIISQLVSEYQKTVTFTLIADPKAAAGLYKVPLEITYADEKGKSYTVLEVLAVSLGDVPKVKPFIKKTSVLEAGKNGKLTLEIANPGTADIRYLELFIIPTEEYTLLTPSDYFYIGNIDADDTESEELEIYIIPDVKLLHLPVKLKYFDANGKQFQQQFDLTMNLYSAAQLQKFGKEPANYMWLYVLVIIGVVGGFLLYKKYKPKTR